jgi:hypothetical protein
LNFIIIFMTNSVEILFMPFIHLILTVYQNFLRFLINIH